MSAYNMKIDIKKLITTLTIFLSLTLLADSRRNRVISQLSSDDWILQAEAIHFIGIYKMNEFQTEIEKILSEKNKGWIRGEAFKAMVKLSPDKASQYAKSYASDSSESVKIAVANLCLELPEKTAIPILKILLKEKGQTYFHALAAYAKLDTEKAWILGEKSLNKIPSNSIESAVRAMAYIANDQSIQKIKALINSLVKNKKPGQPVYKGLSGIKNTKLIPLFFNLANLPIPKKSRRQTTPLVHSNISVRQLWLALSVFEKTQLISELNKFLSNGQNTRLIAQLMASHINDSQLQKTLAKELEKTNDPNVLTIGLPALIKSNPDEFKNLFIKHLTHKDIKVRITSIICVGQCKTVDHFEVLKPASKDSNVDIRNRALSFLSKADSEKVPENIIDYFKESLFSKDQESRKAAIQAIAPHLNRQNSEAALEIFHKFLDSFEAVEFRPLMTAVYPLLAEEKGKELLKRMGYITNWHVIGSFPSGWVSPDPERDGFEFVYPPEKNVDLNEKITVKYNKHRAHKREIVQQDVSWDKVSVRNGEAILYMSKGRETLLTVATKSGVTYAYTEITVPEKTSSELHLFVDELSKQKVWLNGKPIPFEVGKDLRKVTRKVDKKRTSNLVTKFSKVQLNPGKNTILVKVQSNDGAWIGQVTSKRYFSFSVLDPKGKALKWSQK